MGTHDTLPGVMALKIEGLTTYEAWAQGEALDLFGRLKHWDAVAKELAPYLKLSPAGWWHVGQGRKITRRKLNALLAHAGREPVPERCPHCGQRLEYLP